MLTCNRNRWFWFWRSIADDPFRARVGVFFGDQVRVGVIVRVMAMVMVKIVVRVKI